MAHQLRYYPSVPLCPRNTTLSTPFRISATLPFPRRHHHLRTAAVSLSQGGGSSGGGGDGNGSWGSGGGGDDGGQQDSNSDNTNGSIIGLLMNGWRSRVAADPQFPFKLLMEELVGLTSCVLGDMASRPNFGLDELDFVFSTLVVGAIVNAVLMYVLAPTGATTSSSTNIISSSIFASCPKGHMFEPGAYTILDRFGTFVYKGILFSAVGFAAGLLGTAISNGLVSLRKKMNPSSSKMETPGPPTVLNAVTWAAHMGLSCNLRYQSLTGLEFLLYKGLSPFGFKAAVIVLRCINNIFGGVSFVVMARLTGSQKLMKE